VELAMNEFTKSYKIFEKDSLIVSIIYTLGHIFIAMNVVYFMTGSSIWEAGLVALVEPCINGVWFYTLHRIWKAKGK
jgi:uncharacterized membrane protein